MDNIQIGIVVPQSEYRYYDERKELEIYKDIKVYCLNCNNPVVNLIKTSDDIIVLATIFAEEKRKNGKIEVLEELEPGTRCIKLDETSLYDSRENPKKEIKYYKLLINGKMYWTHQNNYLDLNRYTVNNIIVKNKYKK